jgi:deoxyadenosine/deoxycytidine kinase
MNNPSVIYWSEVLLQTLRKRYQEKRREPDTSIELIAAIEETNQRIVQRPRSEEQSIATGEMSVLMPDDRI